MQLIAELPLAPDAFGARADFPEASPLRKLGKRALQVSCLVAGGHSNSSIAEIMGIAEPTVVNHLTAIYRKLQIPEDCNARVAITLLMVRDCPSCPFELASATEVSTTD